MQNRKQASFYLAYDGPDHETHEMNIITLGHSMVALGTALQEANRVVNGDNLDLKVTVSADLKPGSIGVQVLVDMIPYVSDAKNVLELIGITVGASATASTVFNVLSWLKGRKITAVEDEDPLVGSNNVEFKSVQVDGEAIVCRAEIADLVLDPTFRAAMQDLVTSPLQNEGTKSFQIKEDMDSDPVVLIEKLEADSFRKPKLSRDNEKKEFEKKVKFIAANIQKTSGWQVEFNEELHSVQMKDEIFRQRLLRREEAHIFGKTFTVTLEKKTTVSVSGSSKVQYSIISVKHKS